MIITTITGNLTSDPELAYTQSGRAYTKFCIASNRGQDQADFVNCIVWSDEAERIANGEYRKGSSVIAVGRFASRKYEGKTYWECTVLGLNFNGGGKKKQEEQTPAQGQSEEYDDWSPFNEE